MEREGDLVKSAQLAILNAKIQVPYHIVHEVEAPYVATFGQVSEDTAPPEVCYETITAIVYQRLKKVNRT